MADRVTSELLVFIEKLSLRRAGCHPAPQAFVIGLPLRDWHTGVIVETCLELQLQRDGQKETATTLWKKHVYMKDEAREDVSEDGTPLRCVDLVNFGEFTSEEKEEWRDKIALLYEAFPRKELRVSVV